jgi:excisionase family DNA binding protein
MEKKKYLTTTEAGEILGLDRTQVFRLIKAGKIPAMKAGKNYLITLEDLGVGTDEISIKEKKQVEETVEKVFKEYGDVIRKLGEE